MEGEEVVRAEVERVAVKAVGGRVVVRGAVKVEGAREAAARAEAARAAVRGAAKVEVAREAAARVVELAVVQAVERAVVAMDGEEKGVAALVGARVEAARGAARAGRR